MPLKRKLSNASDKERQNSSVLLAADLGRKMLTQGQILFMLLLTTAL